MGNELKPCPFCGGRVKFRKLGATSWITVEHKGRASKCAALTFKAELSREEMAALWNTRASDNRKCGDCKYFKQCGTLEAMKAAHLPVSYDTWYCADFMKRGER